MSAVARDLGIRCELLRRWKNPLAEVLMPAFPSSRKLKPESAELRQLKRGNPRPLQERALLKRLGDLLGVGAAMRYPLVQRLKKRNPVSQVCRSLAVSRSGF